MGPPTKEVGLLDRDQAQKAPQLVRVPLSSKRLHIALDIRIAGSDHALPGEILQGAESAVDNHESAHILDQASELTNRPVHRPPPTR